MSRKTLLSIIAVIGAVLTFFKEQFGLAMDVSGILAGIAAILLYVLWEGKADIKRITAQAGKFKDAKFWLAFVAMIIGVVNEQFGLNLPAEIIIGILTVLMGFLFKKDG